LSLDSRLESDKEDRTNCTARSLAPPLSLDPAFGFEVESSRSGVWGLGFGVWGLVVRVWGSGLGVRSLGMIEWDRHLAAAVVDGAVRHHALHIALGPHRPCVRQNVNFKHISQL